MIESKTQISKLISRKQEVFFLLIKQGNPQLINYTTSKNKNDLHLNMYAKVERTEQKMTWVNNTEYDVKSYQV